MKITLDIWGNPNGYTRLSHYSLSEDEILEAIKNHLIQTGYIDTDKNEKIEISSVEV